MNTSQNTGLERPYITCDRCGHQWTADVEEPFECENCGSRALWAFDDPEKADIHSQYVVERNDSAGVPVNTSRNPDEQRKPTPTEIVADSYLNGDPAQRYEIVREIAGGTRCPHGYPDQGEGCSVCDAWNRDFVPGCDTEGL